MKQKKQSSKSDLLERVKRIVSTVGKMPDRANDDGAPGVKAYLKNKDKPNKVVKFQPKDDHTVGEDFRMEIREMAKKLAPAKFAQLSKAERKAYIDSHRAAASSKAAYGSKKKAKAEAAKKEPPKKEEPKVDDRTVGEKLLDHHKKGSLNMGVLRTHAGKLKPHLAGPLMSHLADNEHEHAGFMANPADYTKAFLHGNAAKNKKKAGPSLGGPKWSHPANK